MQKNKTIINLEWDEIFNSYPDNNFSNHAFPLFLFTERLYENLKENKTKDVLFMSREGQFLKKLFDRYIEIKKELKQDVINIKTHYFCGSRNSIMTASAKPLETETFESLFKFFNFYMSPKSFLHSVGFSEEQVEEVAKSFGNKLNKGVVNFKHSYTFKKLKNNEKFKEIYENNRLKQSNAFNLYMQSFNINYKKDGLVFVDIGYHGTMQDLIFNFFNKQVKITGYFIKTRAKYVENNLKIGLLDDKLNKKLFGSKITKYDSFNYEQILRADHGRCLGYKLNNKNESKPVFDEKLDDKEVFEKYVKTMQDQIFDKFEQIAYKALKEGKNIADVCIIAYYYTIKQKTKTDFKWLLEMQDSSHDDFGFVGYPGRVFTRKLRDFVFKLKDKNFVFKHSFFIKRLKKNLNKTIKN